MFAKIMQLTIPQDKRIVCISDIHGQLDVFKRLLEKVEFCDEDILILVGDLCAGRYNNSQSRQTLEFIMALCESPNVYAVRGNWDFAERLPNDCDETIKARGAEWFNGMPHIIETQSFIFVHAGLSSNNLNEQDAQQCLRNTSVDTVFEKYVIVGHVPTLNYSHKLLSCNPMVDSERRIIRIDGGLDTWGCGQLNALILHNGNFSYESTDNLPIVHAKKAQLASGGELSIIWVRDKEVELIEPGEEFSLYRHLKSKKTIELPNSAVNADENGVLWCSLGTDYFLPVDVGDTISVLDSYKDRIFAKKEGVIGYFLKDRFC